MSTAYTSWEPEEGARWDETLQSHNALEPTQKAAKALRLQIDGFENGLASHTPASRAIIRRNHAPWYYDLHRAERVASAPPWEQKEALRYHLATRGLARNMAAKAPGSLELTQEMFPDSPTMDVEREYMLWRHSLAPASSLASYDSSLPPQIFAYRPMRHGDAENLDDTLRAVYGDYTRSPKVATYTFADVPKHTFVRGTTSGAGHMILGQLPGRTPQADTDNRKTMIEQMAHSILARHGGREVKRFGEAIPEEKRPAHHLAMAMAHGVFDPPTLNPYGREAPSDLGVHHAGRIFGRPPAHDAGLFRKHE